MKNLIMAIVISTAAINLNAQEHIRTQKETDYFAAYHQIDSLQALDAGLDFLKKYPLATTDVDEDRKNGINYGRLYYVMVASRNSTVEENIKRFYNELPFLTLSELYYRQVHLQNYHKLKTPESLIDRSRLLLDKIKTFQNSKPKELSDLSAEDWAKRFDVVYYGNALIHVSLLRKTKNLKEGLQYADMLLSRYGYGITSFNDDYVALLEMAGQKEKEEKALEASVHVNQATPEMLEKLKQFYLAKNKEVSGFDAYVESLKSAEGKASLEKELAASMIKKELPEFKVVDANGKQVSATDWKGKIVILDFWASWCTPCKASFPGMQMAQEKLANEKDVVFYYIDCQERSTDYKNTVMKYIADEKYNFNVLFDTEGDKGITNKVCKQLNVTAIPRKMILDKNGFVRFDMDSYYGSPTKLADEIKIMVNLIQKSK